MKAVIASLLLLVTAAPALAVDPAKAGTNLGNVRGGDFSKARSIIDKNCTTCHKSSKIDEALSAGKDMSAIQREMETRGAKLSAKEREVLGIYWKQSPLKKK
ncbi:cytochrome C [Geobacter pelophilus]|uniref:Cytochrome C n=1 Tax=Geoanaerobacter pelophilus TaxID=60036 RepID=A0AAW4LFW8_9BACT|nr:cytochrome C [Geoanaerobacter pelophilus]